MRKFLWLLMLGSVLVAGCGGGNDNFAMTGSGGGVDTLARLIIPSAGGEVVLPETSGFTGKMIFDPGATVGSEISVSTSTLPPDGVSMPLVPLSSPKIKTTPFYFLTFSVSRPTPLSLLEAVKLQGPLPTDPEQYHADLLQLGADTANGQVLSQQTASFLQEIPGEQMGDEATFDEIVDGATLQPGINYLMRFKGTEEETLDLSVINDSGVSPCYVFITGRNPNLQANDNRFYWVNTLGQRVPMDIDDLHDGVADYNILLPADGKLKLPLMSAGRVYVTLGEKMKTQLNAPPPGTTDPPAYWVAPSGWSNPNEPNYNTLFDWVEFDYKISPDSHLPGMGINKTEVQMVSLPFTISMTGETTGTQTVGAKPGARSAIFQEITDHPEFANLIVHGTGNGTDVSPIRVVSPDNGIYNTRNNIANVPTFPLDYYDQYIDQVWEMYKTQDLAMVTSAFGTFQGRVNGQDQMVFTQEGERSVTIPKPSTADVIIGDGNLLYDVANATTDREKNIVREHASTMSACFNRSTLLVFPKMLRTFVPGSFDPSIFYQATPTNIYSKVIHANSLPTEKAPFGAAYGFGFDDNLDQSSFIGDNRAPSSVTITVTKF